MAAGSFDDQVQYLRREASKYIGSFAVGKAKVVYIPAILTEHKLVKRVSQEKERRDNFVDNHPEAADQPSDPYRKIPTEFRDFLYLNSNPRVKVLPYNSALLANDHTLFMIGDFKRRNEGDAVLVEWQQRHYQAIIRSLDGKLASGWFTTTEHTQPTMTVQQFQVHEIGFLWDEVENEQLRDYDRRAQGFFAGVYVDGELFGSTVDILRGDDDRRSFYAPNNKMYTEDKPGNMPLGTDTCPQSMIDSLRYTAVVSKVVDRQTEVATAADVFNAATINGAKAMGRDDLGRIAPGAKADLLLWEGQSLFMVPLRDPLRNLVYSAQPEDLHTVIIDGEVRMKAREIPGVDVAKLAADLQAAGERMWANVHKGDWAGRSIEELAPQTFPEFV